MQLGPDSVSLVGERAPRLRSSHGRGHSAAAGSGPSATCLSLASVRCDERSHFLRLLPAYSHIGTLPTRRPSCTTRTILDLAGSFLHGYMDAKDVQLCTAQYRDAEEKENKNLSKFEEAKTGKEKCPQVRDLLTSGDILHHRLTRTAHIPSARPLPACIVSRTDNYFKCGP